MPLLPPFAWFLVGTLTGYVVSNTVKKKDEQKALPAVRGLLSLGPACAHWELLDVERLSLVVRKVYIDARLKGISDPSKITNRVLQTIAPKCRTSTQGLRNIGELNLYASVFDSIMALLLDDEIFEADVYMQLDADFEAWHAQEAQRLGA